MATTARDIIDFFANSDDKFYRENLEAALSRWNIRKTDVPRLIKVGLRDKSNIPSPDGLFNIMSRIPLRDFRTDELMNRVPKDKLRKLPKISSVWGPNVNSSVSEDEEFFTGDLGFENLPPLPKQ